VDETRHPHPNLDALLEDRDPNIAVALSFVHTTLGQEDSGPGAIMHAVIILAVEDPALARVLLRVIEAYLMDHGSTPEHLASVRAEFRRGAAAARVAAGAAAMRREAPIDPTH
jgi:hypothetical protein